MSYNDRLRHTLKCAEERFGPRVYADELPSITFHDGPPDLAFVTLTRMVIRLSRQCEHDYLFGCYQLAHETVHLLSPGIGNITTTLEEGVAELFAREYIRASFGLEPPHITDRRYEQAFGLVERFLESRSDAIVRLRQDQPVISSIKADLIHRHYPDIPTSLLLPLVAPFYPLAEGLTRRCS
jgi:hypothetical protein